MKRRPATVVVIGPFRSGTSLACRILSELGVGFGPGQTMLKADRFNPDGYFQHINVRIANNRLLGSAGSTLAWPAPPEVLAQAGDLGILRRVRLEWTHGSSLWGIKDPRFCATLLSWIRAGVFDHGKLALVRMKRDSDTAAADLHGMPELSRQMARRTLASARKTIVRYAELAAWHADHLGVPELCIGFEDLLADPRQAIEGLADFVGAGTRRRIEAACQCVRPSR